ncbi:hypothetical protein Y695_03642 [Hydrogenophaga sp. T4]|nr:hypothetical protein Y695_03642 [Hydrogenophaga sp. T4]
MFQLRRRPPARAAAAGQQRQPAHALRHLAAHGSSGLPERGAGHAGRELQRARRVCRLAARCTHPALAGLRSGGHPQPGWRLQPARHHLAADRKRVLRHDPAQARDLPRRTPAARAARTRRGIRRGPADGPRPVRAHRHRRAHLALSRRVPDALPAQRQPARHAGRNPRTQVQPAPHRRARTRAWPLSVAQRGKCEPATVGYRADRSAGAHCCDPGRDPRWQ